ncbi:MAG: diacylglycerol kinase family protein [Verrucomicrobiota bacterium]|jgi:YegS/Rv2252/BmrU family lipid kinase|nr:diacylglycerol kinase family protein [Verrucomicrobiota bacterium]
MNQPSIALIFNPTARGNKAEKFRKWLGELPNDVKLIETTAPGSASGLAAQAVEDGFRTIVASGGDGTINEVVNGLSGKKTKIDKVLLGILPLGTMNVFARELGISLSIKRAWETVQLGYSRKVDLPLVKLQTTSGAAERVFIQMIGAGLDGDAVGNVSISLKRKVGALAYLASTISALQRKPPKLKAYWDEGSAEGEWMCVGNGKMYGGPFKLFPNAIVDDGKLDLCVLPKVNKRIIANAAIAMLRGRLNYWPNVTYHRVSRLTIEGPPNTLVQADGDYVGTLPLDIKVLQQRLNVLVPRENQD